MRHWSLLAMVLAIAGALALRAPRLDARPLHNDEAVNAVKIIELWQEGRYAYDPDEYHGPTLHYATLPVLWLSGARDGGQLGDSTLRVMTVFSGVAILPLLWLLASGLGVAAVVWSSFFVAVSPAMVFYSRYFIHEMPLICFTALVLGAGWQYARTRAVGWAATTGLGVGLMVATKETFVLSIAAMGAGLVATVARGRSVSDAWDALRSQWNTRHVLWAVGSMGVVWVVLFTSFFTNAGGLLDSVRTYLPWLKRAGGHSPHLHPPWFYLERLAWFHPAKSPVWTEALVLVLAVWGGVISVRGQSTPLRRFLAVYTLALTAIYSAISYKTPWCLLNFYFGMILLAGVGASSVLALAARQSVRIGIGMVLSALTLQLAWQAWRASVTLASDRRNPYVYAQTVPDLLKMVDRAEGLAKVATEGYKTVIQVVAPESDYWPLPWYLRRFENVGWYEALPKPPWSPIVIVASELDARLDEKSDKKWIMAGMSELRPRTFFELYVDLELWKKYVSTLPRDREEE